MRPVDVRTASNEPRSRSPRRITTNASVVGLAAIALTAAQLLRQRGVHSWRTVWAEDGTVFFAQAADHGVSALFHQWGGYLQILPRLLALPTPALPLGWLSVYAAVSGALVTSLLALAIYHLSRFAIPSRLLRAALATATCLLPVLVRETSNNMVNTIWPLTFACFWAVVSSGETRRDRALRSGLCFLGALSQVLVVLYVPLAIAYAWRRRTRASYEVLAALGFGMALQLVAVFMNSSVTNAPSKAADVPELYGVRVVAGAVLGERWVEEAWLRAGVAIPLMLCLVLLVAVVVLASRSPGSPRLLGLAAVGSSAGIYTVAVYRRGTSLMPLVSSSWNSGASRFVGLSTLLLLSGLFILLQNARASGRRHRWLIAVGVLPVVVVLAFPLRYENDRTRGPVWSEQVRRAKTACKAAHSPRSVNLGISPPPAWLVRVSCARILG